MDWSTPIDLYCERTDRSFWAEPANALTNVAFLVAAAAALWSWRRAGGRDGPALALILVVVAVGLGSFTFHTVATRGAVFVDIIPIAIFIYGYLLLALRRFLHLSFAVSVVLLVVYAAGAQALSWLAPSRVLNGSIDYVPARRGLELAVMIFTVSLALRSVDLAACDAFPLGTHFVWHVLNAAVLYVLLRTAIKEAALENTPGAAPFERRRNPDTASPATARPQGAPLPGLE